MPYAWQNSTLSLRTSPIIPDLLKFPTLCAPIAQSPYLYLAHMEVGNLWCTCLSPLYAVSSYSSFYLWHLMWALTHSWILGEGLWNGWTKSHAVGIWRVSGEFIRPSLMRSKSCAWITYTPLILLTVMAKSTFISLPFHLKKYVGCFFTERCKRPWQIGTNSSADCDNDNSWMIHKWLLRKCHVLALCSLSWGMRLNYLIVCWPLSIWNWLV